MKKSDLEIAHVSGFTSWPKRWMSACALIAGRSWSPFRRSPSVMCSFAIISMPPEPQQGSYTVRTTPGPAMRASSPASMRSTIRWTTSRGVKCSPGFSSSASLNLRINSSKIVPMVALSTLLRVQVDRP